MLCYVFFSFYPLWDMLLHYYTPKNLVQFLRTTSINETINRTWCWYLCEVGRRNDPFIWDTKMWVYKKHQDFKASRRKVTVFFNLTSDSINTKNCQGGWGELNPRLLEPQSSALPLSYTHHLKLFIRKRYKLIKYLYFTRYFKK